MLKAHSELNEVVVELIRVLKETAPGIFGAVKSNNDHIPEPPVTLPNSVSQDEFEQVTRQRNREALNLSDAYSGKSAQPSYEKELRDLASKLK